jgi:hypothetical protein
MDHIQYMALKALLSIAGSTARTISFHL